MHCCLSGAGYKSIISKWQKRKQKKEKFALAANAILASAKLNNNHE